MSEQYVPLNSKPAFPLGHVVSTPGALEKVPSIELIKALGRHVRGDWGEVDTDDWQANDKAVAEGSRILSSYTATNGTKFWIISEADRSSTCVLLPEEY